MKLVLFFLVFGLACVARAQELSTESELFWVEEANFLHQAEALYNMLNEDSLEDPYFYDSFIFGVEYLYGWGVSENYLEAEQEYFLNSLNAIQNLQGNETMGYFDVTLADGLNDTVSFWVGVYENDTVAFWDGVFLNQISRYNSRSIDSAYVIKPIIVSPDGGNFLYQTWTNSYTWRQFNRNDDNAKDIFFFGVNALLAEAVAQGALANEHYYVPKLYSAAISRNIGDNYYVYDVQLNTQSVGYVEAIFTVKVRGNNRQLDRYIIFPIEQ